MTLMRLKACPKCGGDCFPEEDQYGRHWVCLQCGNDDIPFEKEESAMPTKLNISDLDKKTIMKLPVPPKPDITGKSAAEARRLMHDYHEANKGQILAEREIIGDTAVRKRWEIKSPTWTGLKRRWNLPINHKGSKELVGNRIVKKRREKPARGSKTPAPSPLVPVVGIAGGGAGCPCYAFPGWL